MGAVLWAFIGTLLQEPEWYDFCYLCLEAWIIDREIGNASRVIPVWEGGLSPRAECPPGHSALGQTVPH